MATHQPRGIADLELTTWAQEFKVDSPLCYSMALKYAQQSQLEVFIERTNETGEWQWAVRVLDAPDFWMDAKPTKALATATCRSMGWKIVK